MGFHLKEETCNTALRDGGRFCGDADGIPDRRRVYWLADEIDRRIGFADITAFGTEFYYYLCDQVGTVMQIVDDSGDIVNQYQYDAWGNVMWNSPDTFEGVENRYLFQGREWDPVGRHYYFRHRVYMPDQRKFDGPDINLAAGILGETEGFGGDAAFGNDPVNKRDPMGLWYLRVNKAIAEEGDTLSSLVRDLRPLNVKVSDFGKENPNLLRAGEAIDVSTWVVPLREKIVAYNQQEIDLAFALGRYGLTPSIADEEHANLLKEFGDAAGWISYIGPFGELGGAGSRSLTFIPRTGAWKTMGRSGGALAVGGELISSGLLFYEGDYLGGTRRLTYAGGAGVSIYVGATISGPVGWGLALVYAGVSYADAKATGRMKKMVAESEQAAYEAERCAMHLTRQRVQVIRSQLGSLAPEVETGLQVLHNLKEDVGLAPGDRDLRIIFQQKEMGGEQILVPRY